MRISGVFSLSLVSACAALAAPIPAAFDTRGDELISRSHQAIAALPSFQIKQTMEQDTTLLQNGKPTGQPIHSAQVTILDIDMSNGLVQMVTTQPNGSEMRVLRRADRAVIKLGDAPWQEPTGPFARIKEQLANPFACPLPMKTPSSPKWEVVKQEMLHGEEVVVVRTVGDSAVGYASQRIQEGLQTAIEDPAKRPKIQVLSYTATHWIRKKDNRRLKVVQESHQAVTLPQESGEPLKMKVLTVTTAEYSRFGSVKIEVPAEAAAILNGK